MEAMNGTKIIAALALGIASISGEAYAQPSVKVKGYVNAPEEIREPVKISVQNEAGDIVWQKTKRHPGMKFKVPAGEVYEIKFEQPGSLTKVVEIDTRHAVRPYTRNQTRPVKFEVIMEAADQEKIQYAGPVGKIDFSERNGRMDVEYDYRLERLAEARPDETSSLRNY